ncbi:MAG: 30S ribosomal protein S3 [Parcubacteria group bacterium CG_4_9_14_0_2_um_filter_41_8]|nr:MAG: 30S ribosomal protein S3 [Parcubacteria group bacterium CG1_02_41_12]PIP67432.1 MAG: 30S ribosomal protein S3 [Parcubacteria group bacterium CG22_combo_CG10-13_8_21_14_all_41_9]PIQ79375.1 MAG: 30S ribosomal protein S3 [Parcubacteria group bacterium CG11_big_fil_rev_8_21_14_0_20_41_14]PIR56715.1 MAG: 30S ribosomal protein S3 [Parcubacteria group bacterium CG10_big_fil_rev_8_21_14_0_10_41_35]PIZ77725.1 MAG: 30S ribosomal protein S3 [Parcubacteria group bacterium CG_4_10_14_0_2_um_filter_4
MGQKIHPKNHRLGIIEDWASKWFAPKELFRSYLKQDVQIRRFLLKKLREARVDNISIERSGKDNEIIINIYTAKPGMVIGRGGQGIEELSKEIEKSVLKNEIKAKVNIHEVRQASLSSANMSQGIGSDIERRIPYRRSAKQALENIKKAGAKGVKIQIKGRLNGAEIARCETMNWGSVPLHTLRANIDYAHTEADTTYGKIGIGVWIYKGEVLDSEDKKEKEGSEDVLKEIKKITSKA